MLLMYPCVMFPYSPGTQYVFCFIIEKSLFAHNISCVSFSLSHLGSLSIWCSLESNKIYWIWLHFIFLNDCVNPRAYGDGLHMSFSELYILTMIVDFATVNNVQWWQLNLPMGIFFFWMFSILQFILFVVLLCLRHVFSVSTQSIWYFRIIIYEVAHTFGYFDFSFIVKWTVVAWYNMKSWVIFIDNYIWYYNNKCFIVQAFRSCAIMLEYIILFLCFDANVDLHLGFGCWLLMSIDKACSPLHRDMHPSYWSLDCNHYNMALV